MQGRHLLCMTSMSFYMSFKAFALLVDLPGETPNARSPVLP